MIKAKKHRDAATASALEHFKRRNNPLFKHLVVVFMFIADDLQHEASLSHTGLIFCRILSGSFSVKNCHVCAISPRQRS